MTHKILIEPIFRITNWPTSIIKTNFLVQAKQFEVGLRFRNVGTEPTETFKITDIRIESAENKDLFHIFDNNFQIDTINPKSTREIWIDKFGTYLNGLAKIRIQILPKNDIDIFETYQKDKFTEILSKIPGHNEWIDFLYIQSQSEYSQNYASKIMLFLSFAVLILGVFSLFETFKQTSYTEFSTRSSRMEQILLIQQAKERCKNTPSSTTSGLFYITNGETTGKEATCEEILQNRS